VHVQAEAVCLIDWQRSYPKPEYSWSY